MKKTKTIASNLKTSIELLPFLLLFCTVFIIRNDLPNPTVTGKYFWFYCSVGLMSLVCIVSVFVSPNKSFRFRWFDAAVFLLWLSGEAAAFLPSDTVSSKFIVLTLLFPLYVCFRYRLAGSRLNAHILVMFFIFTGLIEAVWGLGQLYGFFRSQHAGFKITGSFFNPGPYSGWQAMIFPLALYYVLKYYRVFNKKAERRYFWFYLAWILSALTILCTILILPASMSRSAWLSAAGGSVLAACLYFRSRRIKFLSGKPAKKKIVGIAVSLLVTTVAIFGMYRLKQNSADGRLLIWKTSVSVVAKHPFGAGIGNFCGAYGDEQSRYFASGVASDREALVAGSPEYGFNEYFQICIEWGILPFLLFVGIMFRALYLGGGRRNAASAALFALLIFAAASYPFSVLPFVISLTFLLALCASDLDKNIEKKAVSKFQQIGTKISVTVLTITVFIVICFYFPSGYKAYKEWGRLKQLYYSGVYGAISEQYEKHYPYLSHEISYLFEYLQILNKTGEYAKSNAVIERAVKISCDPMLYNIAGKNFQELQDYESAERSFIRAANMVPSRLYPWYLLAKMYVKTGQTYKARETAKTVLSKEPKVDSPAVKEMREEMKLISESKINN